ncbi:MAG: DUF3795 domain-containing protein [Candidatus Thorarchaeota archaeon]|jgi:hypothetical protein
MRMNTNTNVEVFDMEQAISKCGNYCGTCPWGCYQRARISEEGWEDYKDAAKKYVGFTPTAKPCQSCQTPNENLAKDVGVHNFVRGCLARECATYNEIQNCAYCSRYPCDWIEAHIGEISRENTSERLGEPVPDWAYEQFIEPFQGKAHLDVIRASLGSDEIVESKTVKIPVKKLVEFPENAKISAIKQSDLRAAYDFMLTLATTRFGMKHPDTVTGAGMIKGRRDVLYRLLWTSIQNGVLRDGGKKLVMDGVTYAKNKKGRDPLTTLFRANLYFEMLKKLGIRAKLIQLHDAWTTDMGFLRSVIPKTHEPAWELVVSFTDKIGGKSMLKALKAYANELTREFEKRAYSRFSKADMRFLSA